MLKELMDMLRGSTRTLTENGAVTLRTSGSDCVDLFGTIGALRRASDQDIIFRFALAYDEDPDLAMKMLFYCRDVRGGLGERRVFRTILKHLADVHPESVRKNLRLVSEYGRWDDLTVLLGTQCEKDALAVIREQLKKDLAAAEKRMEKLDALLKDLGAEKEAAASDYQKLQELTEREAEYAAEYDSLMETWETLSEAIEAEERG